MFLLQSSFFLSDNVIEIILKIVHLFLMMLYNILSIAKLEDLLNSFPATLFAARKIANTESRSFVKYVTCPVCSEIYDPEICSKLTVNGLKESELCSYVRFPNHTQGRFRAKCGSKLMKSVSSMDGKKIYLYPHRMYCYQPCLLYTSPSPRDS